MTDGIILTGMPGCGKSTCGVLVAKSLCLAFEDTDLTIQSAEKMPLQKIIDTRGTEYFSLAEEKALLSVSLPGKIVATGGSAVYSDAAMRRFRENGTVIYLRISFSEMLRRIGNIKTRGILLRNGETLEQMFAGREKLYEKYATVIIDCDGLTPEQTVEKICAYFL